MLQEHREDTSGNHEDSEFGRFHGVFGPMLGEGRRGERKRRTVRRGRSFRDSWRGHFIHAGHGHGIRENAGSDREFFGPQAGSRRRRPSSWEGGERRKSVRYQAGKKFPCGASVAEFAGHADVHGVADQPDDVEVMQRMPDAVLQLSTDGRLRRRGRMGFVPAAAHDHTTSIQSIFREFLEGTQEIAASHAGVGYLLFEARVSFRSVVVDFSGTETVNEAAQSLKNTSEVTTDGCIVRSWRDLGIGPIVELKKQMQSLQKHIGGSFEKLRWQHGIRSSILSLLGYSNRARGIHASLWPTNGICLRCRYTVIREATNTMTASANNRPLS